MNLDTDALCLRCHMNEKNRIEIHPSGIAAHKGAVQKVPADFPLLDGHLACITCHDHRVPCTRDPARGIPDPLFLRGGPYMKPWEICFRCHDATRYEVFDVHDQIDERGAIREATCTYCHRPRDPDADPATLVGEPLEPNCISCHRIVPHPAGTNHLRRPPRRERENLVRVSRQNNLYLPLNPQGEIYCCTCHNPHEKGVLDPETPAARGAEGPEPRDHRLRAFHEQICLVCHPFRPYTGRPVVRMP